MPSCRRNQSHESLHFYPQTLTGWCKHSLSWDYTGCFNEQFRNCEIWTFGMLLMLKNAFLRWFEWHRTLTGCTENRKLVPEMTVGAENDCALMLVLHESFHEVTDSTGVVRSVKTGLWEKIRKTEFFISDILRWPSFVGSMCQYSLSSKRFHSSRARTTNQKE